MYNNRADVHKIIDDYAQLNQQALAYAKAYVAMHHGGNLDGLYVKLSQISKEQGIVVYVKDTATWQCEEVYELKILDFLKWLEHTKQKNTATETEVSSTSVQGVMADG